VRRTFTLEFVEQDGSVSKVYGTLPTSSVPPDAPTGLLLEEATAGYVSLSWSGSGTTFTVYRDGVPLGSATSNAYTDSTIVPSTAYSYQVQATDTGGSSALSAALAVTTPANTPAVWSILDQSAILGTAFSLDLTTVCEDIDAQTLVFTITAGAVPGLSIVGNVLTGTPTAAAVTSLTLDVFDGYDHTPVTIDFTVTDPDVTAPTVPGSVTAVANGSTITVSWTDSTDARGVAHYRIYRDGAFRATDTASPYTETGVPVGTYSYTVSAVDSSANANESAQSAAALVTVAPANPDTPINFSATAVSATQIDLSWAPGPNGALPSDYDLDFSTTGASGPWTSLAFVGAGTTYSHTGRTAGVTCYYRLRAGLGAVESGYTTTSATPIDALTPTFIIPSTSTSWSGATLRTPLQGGAARRVRPGDVIAISAGASTTTAVAGVRGNLLISNCQGDATADVHIVNAAGGLTTIQKSGSGGFTLVFEDSWYLDIHFDTWTQSEQGISYGVFVTTTSASAQPSSFIKFNGLHHHIRLSNFKIDGKMTSFSQGGGGCGVQLYDQTYLRADYPGVFWHDILLENFYVRRTKGEGIYGGPNFSGGPLSLGLKDVEIRNFVMEDAGRECIQTKCWYEGNNSIHDFVIRRSGQNSAAAEPAQIGGISVLDGTCNIYNGLILESGAYGLQFFTTGVVANATFSGYGPYSTFDSEVYNVVVARPGRSAPTADGNGMAVGAQASNRVKPKVTAYSMTIVNCPDNAVSFGANASAACSLKNSLIFGVDAVGYTHASNIVLGSSTIFTSPGLPNDEYTLTAPTSAKAAGLSGTDYSATDLRGQPRGTGSSGSTQPDVGAYENI
jgi:hypothetical protein